MYYYYYYSQLYPDDVIVYVEEVNLKEGIIIFDFFDSNQHRQFLSILDIDLETEKTSMVLLKNYYIKKRIQENTLYSIKKKVLANLKQLVNFNEKDSYLFEYSISLNKDISEFFNQSVSIGEVDDFYSNYTRLGRGKIENYDTILKGKISVNIRNVGQGNWNEILVNDSVVVCYDAGAPTNATKDEVRNIIGNKSVEYLKTKPCLFLSHWDKDHYHALVGMSDEELKCFSSFVCIDRVPNLTSRILYSRIETILGRENIYTISNLPRDSKGGPTPLTLISAFDKQLMIFNSMFHKNRNISGIVLAIRTEKSSIILPGDCHYTQLNDYVLPYLNYPHKHNLIVPHHGGKAGVYNYNLKSIISPDKAVISVGRNHFRHPLDTNIKALKSSRFNLSKTSSGYNDILIHL